MQTLCAEILRYHGDVVTKVGISQGADGGGDIRVVDKGDPGSLPRFSLESALAMSEHAVTALGVLRAAGAAVSVEYAEVPSLYETCALADQFRALTDDSGDHVPV